MKGKDGTKVPGLRAASDRCWSFFSRTRIKRREQLMSTKSLDSREGELLANNTLTVSISVYDVGNTMS